MQSKCLLKVDVSDFYFLWCLLICHWFYFHTVGLAEGSSTTLVTLQVLFYNTQKQQSKDSDYVCGSCGTQLSIPHNTVLCGVDNGVSQLLQTQSESVNYRNSCGPMLFLLPPIFFVGFKPRNCGLQAQRCNTIELPSTLLQQLSTSYTSAYTHED